jgi:predicted ATPase/class 3 adenylate cyclase
VGRLPAGTLTFLFTDVEGSTVRWERDAGAMGDAMRRHDAIVRESIERNGGTIIKTGGDSFFAVFERSGDGVAAALDLQRRIGAEDFSAVDGVRVRAALHVGVAEERDGDYFGPAVNRNARLLQAAHGGQVLLTALVAGLVRDTSPPGARYIDLGEHRLRDVSAPEHIFQLGWPDAQADFPPLRTGVEQTNLPPETAAIVGRDADIAHLRAAWDLRRLITITGPGGVGKTSLALHVAGELRASYPDGVWLIDLGAIERADLVIAEFETTLGLSQLRGTAPLPSLVAALSGKNMLLVVDNCEHLLGAVTEAIAAIVRGAPGVQIVATSREPLRVAGEFVYALEPLAIEPAVELFAERATGVAPFELTPANKSAVEAICRRLDGIPYAIELAAARTNILGAAQIASRLDERFRFLKSGRRDAAPRQQTLYAMIDWSYSLLDETQRAAFRKLAVFPGGWTLAGAAAVCALDETDALEILSELADKSLVVSDRRPEPRFRYLESTRDYAQSALQTAGEADAAAAALFAHQLAFARSAESEYGTLPEEAWIDRVEAESENVRAALEWSLGEGHDVPGGAELAVLLGRYWHLRRYHEGVHWLSEAAQRDENLDAALQIRVLSELVRVDPFASQTLSRAERALAAARELGEPGVLARVMNLLAGTLINVGRYREAESLIAQSRTIAQSAHDTVVESMALLVQGYAALYDQRFADAERRFRECMALAQEGMRTRDRAMALRGLGFAYVMTDRGELAEASAREALHAFEQLDDRRGRGIAASGLAFILHSGGKTAEASAYALEAIRLLADAHLFAGFCEAVVPLAAIYEATGDHASAARMAGYLQTHWSPPFQLPAFIQSMLDATLERLERSVPADELQTLLAEGGILDERAVARAALQGRPMHGEKADPAHASIAT